MEYELSPQSIARLADALAPRVAKIIKNELKKPREEQEWICAKEAAMILGISVSRMRHIKDRFPHIKSGNSAQGSIRFLRSALIENYAK